MVQRKLAKANVYRLFHLSFLNCYLIIFALKACFACQMHILFCLVIQGCSKQPYLSRGEFEPWSMCFSIFFLSVWQSLLVGPSYLSAIHSKWAAPNKVGVNLGKIPHNLQTSIHHANYLCNKKKKIQNSR